MSLCLWKSFFSAAVRHQPYRRHGRIVWPHHQHREVPFLHPAKAFNRSATSSCADRAGEDDEEETENNFNNMEQQEILKDRSTAWANGHGKLFGEHQPPLLTSQPSLNSLKTTRKEEAIGDNDVVTEYDEKANNLPIIKVRMGVVPLEKPREPDASECCGNGCQNCVWTVYWEELEAYNEARAKQDHDQDGHESAG